MPEYLSPKEYAARYGYSLRTVYKWVEGGKLPIVARTKGMRLVRIIVRDEAKGATENNVVAFRARP